MAKRQQYPNPEPALTFPEAAERLGTPVSDLYRLWHEGRIRAVSVFGRWRIHPNDLEAIGRVLDRAQPTTPCLKGVPIPPPVADRPPPAESDTISIN